MDTNNGSLIEIQKLLDLQIILNEYETVDNQIFNVDEVLNITHYYLSSNIEKHI